MNIETFHDYQNAAARTIGGGLSTGDVEMHALHGMVSEIGEIHGLYQKVYQGHRFDSRHMKLEVGDLLWFVAEYCTAMGWPLEEIAAMNILKLLERYPDGFDAERSLHRREGDE